MLNVLHGNYYINWVILGGVLQKIIYSYSNSEGREKFLK